jgi:hypothetical protein
MFQCVDISFFSNYFKIVQTVSEEKLLLGWPCFHVSAQFQIC